MHVSLSTHSWSTETRRHAAARPRSLRFVAFAVLQSLVIASVWTAVVLADETSRMLDSEGALLFQERRYVDALQKFDAAVEADASDLDALYYRGVTRGRVGDNEGAIADLETVVRADPDRRQAELELGIVLVQAERYREALIWLGRASEVDYLSTRAGFYSGLAELRLDQRREALAHFRAAASDPVLELAAVFYQGVVEFDLRDWAAAREHFEEVVRRSSGTEMGREARRYLDNLRRRDQRYELHALVGWEYDTNVVLAPSGGVDDNALAVSNQADVRANFLAGAGYVPWQTDWAQLRVGYDFFQSVYSELSAFNLQDHRPALQLTGETSWLRGGVSAEYDYYLLQTDSFLQQVSGSPWLEVPEGEFGHTEISYRVRWRDFFQRADAPRLDALNQAVGVRQVIQLFSPERFLSLGWRFDSNDATHAAGDPFSYDGNGAEVGLHWWFPAVAASVDLGYRYTHESFSAQSRGRRDNEHAPTVFLRKALGEHLAATVAYYGTFHQSNQAAFEYDRQIVSVGAEVFF